MGWIYGLSTSHVPAGSLSPSFFPFFLPIFKLKECKSASGPRVIILQIVTRSTPFKTRFCLSRKMALIAMQQTRATLHIRFPLASVALRKRRGKSLAKRLSPAGFATLGSATPGFACWAGTCLPVCSKPTAAVRSRQRTASSSHCQCRERIIRSRSRLESLMDGSKVTPQ